MKAIPVLLAACAFAAAAPLHAQTPLTPVTVLAFTADGDTDGMEMELYNALRTQIEFHRDYRLNDVPPQSLDELLLAVGCAELDVECSQLVADIVGTQVLAWGSLSVDENYAALTMTLFDLELGTEIRSRSHIVAAADKGVLVQHHQVMGRSLLYGADGELRVTSAPDGARVYLNGQDEGLAPITVSGLAFGLHEVRVEADGYAPSTEVVVIDIGETEHHAVLRAPVVQREPRQRRERTSSMSPATPAWIAIGTGAALTATGVVFGVQSRSTQSEFDDVAAERVLDRERAMELQDQGERQARMSNVFVATGATVLVAGVVWRAVVGRPDQDTASSGSAQRPQLSGFAVRGGGGATLGLQW